MCSGDDYKKWENGEVYYWQDQDKFATKDQIVKEMKEMTWYDGRLRFHYTDEEWNNDDILSDIFSDERVKTCEEFFEDEYYECFEDKYTTPGGEEVVAFGYYGHD